MRRYRMCYRPDSMADSARSNFFCYRFKNPAATGIPLCFCISSRRVLDLYDALLASQNILARTRLLVMVI